MIVKFVNEKFKTSEFVVIRQHLTYLLTPVSSGGGRKPRLFPQGGIAKAYAMLDQLEQTALKLSSIN